MMLKAALLYADLEMAVEMCAYAPAGVVVRIFQGVKEQRIGLNVRAELAGSVDPKMVLKAALLYAGLEMAVETRAYAHARVVARIRVEVISVPYAGLEMAVETRAYAHARVVVRIRVEVISVPYAGLEMAVEICAYAQVEVVLVGVIIV